MPDMSAGTDPGESSSFTVAELLAAGFDETGALQPVLRPAGVRASADWPARRHEAATNLARRGLLVEEPSGWQPTGALRTVLYSRAAARLTVEVLSPITDDNVLRWLVFGMLTDDEVMVVTERRGSSGEDRCDCEIASVGRLATDLVAEALGDSVQGSADGPVEWGEMATWSGGSPMQPERTTALESLRVDDPAIPPEHCRVGLLVTPEGPRLVVGSRQGRTRTGWTRLASKRAALDAVTMLLAGDLPSPQP